MTKAQKYRRRNSLPGESLCCCLSCSSLIQISIIVGVIIIVFLPAIIRVITSANHEIISVADNIFIHNPTVNTNATKSKNETEVKIESKAAIILFGWPGASDSQMAKYQEMYTNEGYSVIQYTAPWTYSFFNGEKIQKSSKDFVIFLENIEGIEDKLIFFHVFSNLGCSMYHQVIRQQFLKNINFQGVIFDSCPGRLSVKSFFNTMGFVIGGNVLRRKTIPIFYFRYFLWKKLLRITVESKDKEPLFWWDDYNYLENDENSTKLLIPQLYIYSKVDVCVDSEEIKEFASKQSLISGLEVIENEFEESNHVSHLDKYPKKYEDICLKFLQNILSNHLMKGNKKLKT